MPGAAFMAPTSPARRTRRAFRVGWPNSRQRRGSTTPPGRKRAGRRWRTATRRLGSSRAPAFSTTPRISPADTVAPSTTWPRPKECRSSRPSPRSAGSCPCAAPMSDASSRMVTRSLWWSSVSIRPATGVLAATTSTGTAPITPRRTSAKTRSTSPTAMSSSL